MASGQTPRRLIAAPGLLVSDAGHGNGLSVTRTMHEPRLGGLAEWVRRRLDKGEAP